MNLSVLIVSYFHNQKNVVFTAGGLRDKAKKSTKFIK